MSSTGDDSDIDRLADAHSTWPDPVDDLAQRIYDDRNGGSTDPIADENWHHGSEALTVEEDFGSDEDDRENRFDGPSSTWRFFTEDERTLAVSLDQQQANDLSIHLYNVHALKSSIGGNSVDAKSHRTKKRRKKNDDAPSLGRHPGATWTAWPLGPQEVPRKQERFGLPVPSRDDDDATYRKLDVWKPKADLEEEIKALILSKAKEQFRNGSTPENLAGKFDMTIDEDQTDAILDPTVCHILAEFDNLLLGLHKARQNLSRSSSQSRKASRSNTESGDRRTEDPTEQSKAHHALNPRDWSEVLSVASLVGFKSNVVNRATNRCGLLLDKNAGITAKIEEADEDAAVGSQLPPNIDTRIESATTRYYCPVTKCKRHWEPFDLAWRWREHLKRSHKYGKEDVEEAEGSLNGQPP